ncbi:MAG: hypothetical protein JWN63_418 [Candidatus Acidoferrum typicum]|nr:hypothetical protein [Candidatus Acidoferrum typicum]
MNKYETALFVSFLAAYFPAVGLFHFMLFRVNSQLPPDSRLPHSLSWGDWNRLKREYKRFCPRSIVYQLTVSSAVAISILAIAMLTFRFWEYASCK